MNAVEKAAEVLAAHRPITGRFAHLNGVVGCSCMDRVFRVGQESYPDHIASMLADARLLIAAFPDGSAGTLTGDLLTDMAAYAGRLRDRAEAAERALATLREDVAREIEADRSLPWNAMHHEALRAAARIARGGA